MDRSHVLIRRWTMSILRMTCLTGGRTPRGAATGIPGRRATSCLPCAVPVPRRRRHLRAYRSPVHDRRLPLNLVPPAALPARRSTLPRHWRSQPSDVVRRSDARWRAQYRGEPGIVSRRRATQSLLKRSITGIYQSSSYSGRRQPTGGSRSPRGSHLASEAVAGSSTAEPSQWLARSASSTSLRFSPTGRPMLSCALRTRYWTVFLCSLSHSAVVL